MALEAVGEILAQPYARTARMFYLLSCLNNLKAGASMYPSIVIAIGILEGLDAA